MTRPIHTILVPLDLTERVEAIVEWAIGWALMTHARIVLLHVVGPLNSYTIGVHPDPEQHYGQSCDEARKRLLTLAQLAKARGIETSIEVQVGPPTEGILAMASVTDTGLIILGTHGRKGLAHAILGSIAEKIVQLAECPVFVVKDGHMSIGHDEKTVAEAI